jgi:hypothetical protein
MNQSWSPKIKQDNEHTVSIEVVEGSQEVKQ